MIPPDRSTIEELARDNPAVHACLMLHYRSDLTYEQALIAMVVQLARENGGLLETQKQLLATGRPSLLIQVSNDEQIRRFITLLKERETKGIEETDGQQT